MHGSITRQFPTQINATLLSAANSRQMGLQAFLQTLSRRLLIKTDQLIN
jgi:hypothetical protein